MLNREVIKGRRNAASATETVMTIVLVVAALFVAMRMFGDNLANMLANNPIKKMMDGNPERNRNSWEKPVVNYSLPENQVHVSTVGAQAQIEEYLTQAKGLVENYKENPPEDEEQMQDLAKRLTIMKICGELNSADKRYFYDKYGIEINVDPFDPKNFSTSIHNFGTEKRSINFSTENLSSNEHLIDEGNPLRNIEDQLTLIKKVSNSLFSYD